VSTQLQTPSTEPPDLLELGDARGGSHTYEVPIKIRGDEDEVRRLIEDLQSPPGGAGDDPSDVSQEEAPPAEYDATSRQRAPVLLGGDEGLIKVALIFDPCANGKSFDTHLREYVRRLTTIKETETARDEMLARASTELSAAVWLFGTVIVDAELIGDDGEVLDEEKPEEWRSMIGETEKLQAVENIILHGYVVNDDKPAGQPSWKSLGGSLTRLRCLYEGREVETRHTLRKVDTRIINDYLTLTSKAAEEGSAKIALIMFDLAALYDRVKIGARGYKGGVVPAHHKAAVFGAHAQRQVRAIRKN
jgi:hypothetical protein